MSDVKEIEIIPVYYDYVLAKKYPVNILVGGRNSGKSYFMEQLVVINMHNNNKYKLLVIEDVETNIGAGVKDGIEKRAEEFEYSSLFKPIKQPPEISHKISGSTVIFKGYHSKEQQKQVKSLNEVTAAWYEEAENITYDQFKALRMQLRGGEEENRQLFLTLNPINADGFINRYFFQNKPDKVFERFSDGRPKVFEKYITVELENGEDIEIVSIPCIIVVTTHWDNPYLTREQRADIEELKYTDPDQYAMLAEGKFVKGKGAYFQEFEKHIHVINPFVIPEHWDKYRVSDYGLDKLASYWVAIDTIGNAYFYKELYQSDLIISDAAKRILEINERDNIRFHYAPPDLWNRRQDTGKSAAEIFHENGVPMYQAKNERILGWYAVKEWLKVFETRDEQTGEKKLTSRLKIFSTCSNLIRTLAQIQKDEKNPNDVAKEPHELTHAPDALRYFCCMRTLPTIEEVKKKELPWFFRTDDNISDNEVIQW